MIRPDGVVVDRLAGIETHAPTVNWTGGGIQKSARTFDYLWGFYQVPNVTIHGVMPSIETSYSATWLGMDGCAGGTSTDLIQAGSEGDVTVTWNGSRFVGAASNYAWAEWVPDKPKIISSLVSYPGNFWTVRVWIGDSSGSVNITGSYMWCDIYDNNQDSEVRGCMANDPNCFFRITHGQFFVGDCAEWITERPGLGAQCGAGGSCTYPALSNFGSFPMQDCYASDTHGVHTFATDDWKGFDMYANQTQLAHVTTGCVGSPACVQFNFDHYIDLDGF